MTIDLKIDRSQKGSFDQAIDFPTNELRRAFLRKKVNAVISQSMKLQKKHALLEKLHIILTS